MSGSRHFKCYGCDHEWEVPYGTGLSGLQMECPKCGSDNIHRTDIQGQGRGQCSRPRGKNGTDQEPEFTK